MRIIGVFRLSREKGGYYSIEEAWPPGADLDSESILLWSTSKLGEPPSADDEEDDDAGSLDDITIPSEDI